MGDLIASLGGPLLDAVAAAATVSGLAALAMVVTRQPSRRRTLARAGVVGTLLVFPLIGLRPFAPIDVSGPVLLGFGPALERVGGLAAMMPRWAVATARAAPGVLLVAYLAGVALGLGRLALGWFGSGWIGRNSDPASAEAESLYRSLAADPGRSRPRLRVSPRTSRPVLLGLFRPTILVPPDLDRPESAGALRLALLHELAHAEGADPWFALAGELAAVVWFWLPPLRWIGRQMRLDQEFLADRRAADRLGAAARYASGLVAIAAGADPRPAVAAPPAGTSSSLRPRVLMLVRCPFPVEGRPPRWWRLAVGLATAVALLLSTGLTLRPRSPSPRAPEVRDIAIPRIVLDAGAAPSTATTLPIRLPEDFDLGFVVDATGAELGQIRVLGHPLGPPGGPGGSAAIAHRVALRRRAGTLALGLDSGPMTPLAGTSSEGWFTARGLPDRPTVLRAFHLSW